MYKEVWRKIQKRPMEACLALLLFVQITLILISNVKLIGLNIDCDNAKLMKHIITMWEEKAWAIPGWSYRTTLEWDCTTLFALPLYGLTHNIYVACALSNTLLAVLLVAVIFYLFSGGQQKLCPLLCANLICIPYRVGMLDYYNMLFLPVPSI